MKSSTFRFLLMAVAMIPLATLFAAPGAWAAAYSLPSPDTQVVGAVRPIRARFEDTLASLAEQHGLGWRELVAANPDVDPWLPGEGTLVQLPTKYVLPPGSREGVVINASEFRLYYFPPGGNRVITYPVGLGRLDFPTPLVNTQVRVAVPNPTWSPGPNARREHAARGNPLPAVVPPGPDNPLGSMAIMLGIPSYFIHGTNQPFAVGQTASLGCVRMYNHHVEALAELVPRGTPVRIVNEPYKVGWRDGDLYVEIHEDIYGTAKPGQLERLLQSASTNGRALDWDFIRTLTEQRTGIPTRL